MSSLQHLKIRGASVQSTGSVKTSLEMAPATESVWCPAVSETGSTAWRSEGPASKSSKTLSVHFESSMMMIWHVPSWFTVQDTSSIAATTTPTLTVSKAATAPPVGGMAVTASQTNDLSGLKARWSFTLKSHISAMAFPTALCSGPSASSSKHQSNWELLLPWAQTGTSSILTPRNWPACWPRPHRLIRMGIWIDTSLHNTTIPI